MSSKFAAIFYPPPSIKAVSPATAEHCPTGAAPGRTTAEAFLAHLRSRLQPGPKAAHPGRWPGRLQRDAGRADARQREDLVDRFLQERAAVGGQGQRVHTPAGLVAYLRQLMASLPGTTAVRDGNPRWLEPQAQAWLAAEEQAGLTLITHDAGRDQVAAAALGITWADWAIAQTGSLVQLSGSGRSRLVSLPAARNRHRADARQPPAPYSHRGTERRYSSYAWPKRAAKARSSGRIWKRWT